ncbi:MAG TPA: hypothetical protein VJY41_11800 [Prolixibacteraceae bacterium]|nr:hypothetical protein [Prolixibacteraceae bacterium]
MKKINLKNAFYFILVILTIWSCGTSQRELAVKKINMARQHLNAGDTLQSIILLDSIKILYPKAEVQQAIAKNILMATYQQIIDNRKIQMIRNDSLILDAETKFDKVKTEFDRYMQYNHKRQTFMRSWNRSFLQVHLDERGELYLSSNYMGKEWLNHTGIRVYDEKLQAKSERVPVDDMLNHQSDFLDHKWEKVTYMNGRADSVITFIANNNTLNLKCVFLGSRYYYIVLESYDKQAVIDALTLSNAIKRKKQLEDEIVILSRSMKSL